MAVSNFIKRVGSTTIGNFEYEGKILYYAQRQNGASLLMDVLNSDIPDGQTAYLFDNKLIITVHWANFSKEDMDNILSDIKLRMAPFFEWGLTFWVKFGNYRWGDILTLPGLISSFNNEEIFDGVIFLFVDSSNGNPIAIRTMSLHQKIGELIESGNYVSYMHFHNSEHCRPSYQKTQVPLLFSDWLDSLPLEDKRTQRNLDYDAIEEQQTYVAGIDMDSDDKVTYLYNPNC